nr:reverse transcriptase domain-containing protein [Tanacetum cinerariifolium]
MARTLLNEHCSAVLVKKLPKKLGDPGKLSLLDLKPTCMTLELADRSISRPVGVAEDVYVKKIILKTGRALIDVFEGELTLRVGKNAITFNLDQTSRYSANYSDMTAKRIDVIDMACEEYSQEVLGFSDTISSGNPTPYYDPIVFATSPTLASFGNSDFLLEEVDAFLAIEDEPTSSQFHQSYLDPEGDIILLEAFLNDDPLLPTPNHRNYLPEVRKELKICEAKSDKSLVDEPSVVENKLEATKDTVNPTNNENTEDVQPQAVQSESLVSTSKPVTSLISEPTIAPVSASKHNPKALIPYPSRRNDERNHEKANTQIEKFYQIFKDMSFEISFADALIFMPKFTLTLKTLIGNKEKLSEMARTSLNEHCSAVLLKKLPKKLGDPGKFLIPCDFPMLGIYNKLTNLTDLITKFVNSNSASTSSSGTFPNNTIANLKSDLKAINTQSGVSYGGP